MLRSVRGVVAYSFVAWYFGGLLMIALGIMPRRLTMPWILYGGGAIAALYVVLLAAEGIAWVDFKLKTRRRASDEATRH